MTDWRDRLVSAVTCSITWADLVHSMEAHGYIPTVRPVDATHRRLRTELQHAGYKVFPWEDTEPARVRFTRTQMHYLLDLAVPAALGYYDDAEVPWTCGVTWIETTPEGWGRIAYVVGDGLEDMVGPGQGWDVDTPARYEFAVAAFRRSVESMLERINKELGWRRS